MENTDKEKINEVRERFSRISITKGFITVFFLSIIAAIGIFIILSGLDLTSTWEELIITYIIYAIPFFLFVWVLRRAKLPITSIFKGDSATVSQVVMVIPLMALSIGVIWMIVIGLNLISTGAAESYVNWLNSIEMFDLGPETTMLQYILIFGSIAIVAPVVEEIIFRGIMIERLGAKYSYKHAVIISSIIFGILHVSPVGAFMIGLVLSLVYLKTGSLMVPILIHIANNAIATWMMIASAEFDYDYGAWETAAPYISNAWIGIFLFTASVIWLGWYLKQNWKVAVGRQPFDLNPVKKEEDVKMADQKVG